MVDQRRFAMFKIAMTMMLCLVVFKAGAHIVHYATPVTYSHAATP
jgi:hypothetical protein